MKETGVDDSGLNEFATEYFPHPTYKDEARAFYRALGSGKLKTNPRAMWKLIKESKRRIKDLDVKTHNVKGEGFLQGGWILFNPDGTPRAAFQENARERVPIDDILKEVESMRRDAGEDPAGENPAGENPSEEKKEDDASPKPVGRFLRAESSF